VATGSEEGTTVVSDFFDLRGDFSETGAGEGAAATGAGVGAGVGTEAGSVALICLEVCLEDCLDIFMIYTNTFFLSVLTHYIYYIRKWS
jgi:hypothetical protein